MQSTALLLFESPVEAQGMAGTLREFDPAFEPRIVDDIAVLALVRGGERFRPVADDSAVSPTITSNAAAEPGNTLGQFGLTRAEHDVLVQVAQGKTNLQIANELGKQEGTVRIQMSSILRKLGVAGRSEAIVVAMREQSVIDAHLLRVQTKPADLSWLYPHMEFRRHRQGHVLFREGDRGSEMFILQKGRASLPQLGLEMQENDMFGEIAIFAPPHRRTSSAVCATDASLFVLAADKVRKLFYLDPAFALTMLELIMNRLLADARRAG